ncbi:MAG TPA: type II toxin-antitoxin system PemK/MazF family toxin [Nocardioidaceae bacterium]|nr:type II toxin-antitoxin system PemK/MazF family toxin [Nocardioidaceae bacterium]
MRGEVYRICAPRDDRGHEQRDPRYAVVVQSDQFPLSTWLVAPTSTSARPASFGARDGLDLDPTGDACRDVAYRPAAVPELACGVK